MQRTALKLYSDAYKLQHLKNDLLRAKAAYRSVVNHYPLSDAAEYAAIQLRALNANEALTNSEIVNDAIAKPRAGQYIAKENKIFPITLSLISLSLMLAIIVLGIFKSKNISRQFETISLLSVVESKIISHNEEEALLLLSELKVLDSKNITPFIIGADIYEMRGNYVAADRELLAYKRLNPDSHEIDGYINRLHKKGIEYARAEKIDDLINKKPKTKIKKQIKRKKSAPTPKPIINENISYF